MTDVTTTRFVSAIRRAAVLGLVALYCLAPMRSASAQVAISGNYYEDYKNTFCGGSSSICQLAFDATPQIVLITDVSCYFSAGLPIINSLLGVSDSATPAVGQLRRLDFFPPQLLTTGNYVANVKTNFLFGAGKWPTISLTMTGAATANMLCKIVGTFQLP